MAAVANELVTEGEAHRSGASTESDQTLLCLLARKLVALVVHPS